MQMVLAMLEFRVQTVENFVLLATFLQMWKQGIWIWEEIGSLHILLLLVTLYLFNIFFTFNWKRSFFFFKMCFYYNELWYDGNISESCHSVCLIMHCRCFFKNAFWLKNNLFWYFSGAFWWFWYQHIKNHPKAPKKKTSILMLFQPIYTLNSTSICITKHNY